MLRGTAAAALVVCVLVAGCAGPFAEGESTDEPTGAPGAGGTGETTTDSERVIAAPPDTDDGATVGTGTAGTETGGTAVSEASAAGTTETGASGTTGSAVTDATATVEPAERTSRRTTGTGNETATRATFDRDVGYELRVSNAGPTARNVTVRIAAANGSAVAFDESIRLGPNESSTFGVDFPRVGTYEAAVSVGDETATRRWEVADRDPDEALSVHVSESGEVYLGFVEI
ncbi:hypothetical protein [Halorussus sp. AFM4]|uniref:hypothetical protein n=1 Tax=Halorussus sp. AFM4 TaxID=3421651 RepID=UPI003EB80BD1